MNDPSLRWDINFRDRSVPRVIRINEPVGFQPGEPVPGHRPDQFQVLHTCIPAIKHNTFRTEPAVFCYIQHVPKMIVLGLTICIFVVDPKIYGNNRFSIRPDSGNQVDSLDHPMVFPAPVAGNE